MRFLLPFLAGIFAAAGSYAQTDMVLKKKTLGDSILLPTRELILPDPFNGEKALEALFPGRHYNLSKTYKNEMVNWSCPTCKAVKYPDANDDEVLPFPYKNGVATRLMNVMDFSDSSGMQYKVISFNHSEFEEDGFQTSRFTGGLLGLAKFVKTDAGWKLRMYAPAIKAYGSFSQSPTPTPLLIGQEQYAFVLKHSNGPGGGPFYSTLYLIAGINGTYQQIMVAFATEKTGGDPEEGDLSKWTSTYSVPVSDKKYFRDILITTKGEYDIANLDGFPVEAANQLKKQRKAGKFVMVQRYVYKGKGYELQPGIQVKVN
ncbi:hypothetical protein [Chitinophaga sp. sic0106]|uniref:hypothetical protein n=1 Tax=Chitinophaga sp. sic0106 TaxID=2854785 RepID=UPI001C4505FD|nr:hypothetical protein [Chitinophaga sp. sic0106]MBV7533159.1 hypothetical protein [Chitinophaga sp. sic0106]